MKWAIVIEKSENGYGGYAPDFPGLGVVGDTQDEVRQLLAEGMELYLEEVGKQFDVTASSLNANPRPKLRSSTWS